MYAHYRGNRKKNRYIDENKKRTDIIPQFIDTTVNMLLYFLCH